MTVSAEGLGPFVLAVGAGGMLFLASISVLCFLLFSGRLPDTD